MSDEQKHDCDCGCEHDDECEETVVLTDENGKEHEFVVLDTLEIDSNTYMVLMPVEDEAEADEAIILKLEKDEAGNEILVDIEDDEEWEKVADVWQNFDDEAE